MVRSGPTNPNTRALIRLLHKTSARHNTRIWKRVAELVERPARQHVVVNIGKIERHTRDGDIVVVPGKVLGAGVLTHRVTVAALSASAAARSSIVSAGGTLITIDQLMAQMPNGAGVTIIT